MQCKMTVALINSLTAQEKPFEVRDTGINGLILRVQPTGRKTYYFEYRNADGKRNRVKLGVHPALTLPRAQTKAKVEAGRVAEGEDPAAKRREGRVRPIDTDEDVMTLERFILEVWSPTYKITRKAHDPQLNRLLSGFRPLLDLPLASLTRDHFERHMIERSKKPLARTKKQGKTKAKILPSSATLNRCNATMRPVLEMARKQGLIAINPLADVAKAREDKNRAIRAMTMEEEKSFEQVFTKRREERLAEVAEINERRATEGRKSIPAVPRFLDSMEPMFVLSVETGIRRGEAFSLEWADVDLQARKLTVRGEVAKSSQSRVVPLTKRAQAILSDWREQSEGDGLVFPSRIGGGRLKNIDGAWRELCREANITKLRWHDLRHTFGTRAALAGVSMVVLKALMGHSAITTTERYTHTSDDAARQAIALMERK